MRKRFFGLILAISATFQSVALAQEVAVPIDAQPQEIEGGFSALSVVNIDTSVQWYVKYLRFEVVSKGTRPEQAMEFALLRRENSLVEILARKGMQRDPVDDRSWRHGVFKLGFWVRDLQAEEHALRNSGVEFLHGIVSPPNQKFRTFAIKDPDGNSVQFFGE